MIYDDLRDRATYAVGHHEPVYVTAAERDKLVAAFGDTKSLAVAIEVDDDKAAAQQAAATGA